MRERDMHTHIYIYVRDRESIRFLPHGFFELPGTVDPGSCAQVVGGGKVQKLRYRSISLIGLFDFFYFFCSTSFSLFRPAFPLQQNKLSCPSTREISSEPHTGSKLGSGRPRFANLPPRGFSERRLQTGTCCIFLDQRIDR